MNQIDLRGRVAVITGGARGIGLACAERLLQSGASVLLWDKDEQALDRAANALKSGPVKTFAVDVGSEPSVAEAAAASGPVDILVNNAGVTGPNKTSWEYQPD